MSVNLQKGQKVDLTKGNTGLKKIMVGLGWDEAPSSGQGKGLLGSLFGGGNKTQSIDCDASAILCGSGGKIIGGRALIGQNMLSEDIVYFGNLSHTSRCVKHMGDNLTGAGEGDDEQIMVDLQDLPSRYEKIVFVVNIYKAGERNQHFGMIKNAFIRIVDAGTNKELCKFNLSDSYDNMTAMIFGEVYRYQNEWKFNAMGEGTRDSGIVATANRYI